MKNLGLQYSEALNLVGKINFKKLRNAIEVYQSYRHSRKTGNVIHPAMPYALSVEPTTSCNLRCPECISGLRAFTRPTGMLDPDLYAKIIEDVREHLIYLTLYFQGEPYLNQHFFDFVSMASDSGIYTNTSTNAHYLNPENAEKTVKSGLDRIIVSIDGLDQETYEKYRIGGDLSKVSEGLNNLVRLKKMLKLRKPFIDLQFIAMGTNEHQLKDVNAFAAQLGVDRVLIKTAQVNDFENGSVFIPSDESLSRYKYNEEGKWVLKNRMDNHCWKMWHSAVITWDGNVVPCCFDKDSNHSMGNIKDYKFEEIWNNDAYKAFRSNLFKSRSEIDICSNCSEGTKIWN